MTLLLMLLSLLCVAPAVSADEAVSAVSSVSSVMTDPSAGNVFTLLSPAFKDGDSIPLQYTCRGADISPPLHIEHTPPGTKSLALTVHDPDGVTGTWVHWVVFNIAPHTVDLAEKDVLGTEALNDFGNFYYGGPCPPDMKPHHYVFTLYAINEVLVDIDEGATMDTLLKTTRGKVLGKAVLTGIYQRMKWE